MCVNMNVISGELNADIKGDIDHHTSALIRNIVDDSLMKIKPSVLKMDFKNVTFMDSSGVGLVMGRYKVAQSVGCSVKVINLTEQWMKIMKMSGLEKIVKLERIEK